MNNLELCDALAIEVLGWREGPTNNWAIPNQFNVYTSVGYARATELHHSYPNFFRPDQHITHLYPVWEVTGKPKTTYKTGKICMELRHKEFLVSDKQTFSTEQSSNFMCGDICLSYWRALQARSGDSSN